MFGIGLCEFEAILERQGGGCAICGEVAGSERELAVDHNHDTHEVRGILCNLCNVGLGYFRDDTDRLIGAAMYLTRTQDVLTCHS